MKTGMGLAMLTLALGCASHEAARLERQQSNLRRRAGFDLQCPEQELTLTPLGRVQGNGYTQQYGVRGCGRQGTYVQILRSWDADWIANTSGGDSGQ